MKKAIITTDVGGISETLDKNASYLIKVGDHKEWIDKITILLKNDDKRQQMGQAAHDFVKNEFSWQVLAKRFVEILDLFEIDRKSTRLNSSHSQQSRMPSSA